MTQPGTSPTTASGDWTVQRILEWTTSHLDSKGSETPRLDAEILLAHARGCSRVDLYTRFAEVLTDAQRATMRELVQRRANLEPVAYLVGYREFFGLEFRVTPDVLVPRPDTETLVMEVLEAAREIEQPRILDVGTGSGCIAVSSAVQLSKARVTAIDISETALSIARQNADKHTVTERIDFRLGDLFEPLDTDVRFDIVASNAPYICDNEAETIQPDVRLHEPSLALYGGRDGLDVIRRLISESPLRLVSRGHLMLEIAPEQADAVGALLAGNGSYGEPRFVKDLAGAIRVVVVRTID